PRLAPGRAYHQAQHRVAPAAGHALAVPGEQVVHRVHPGRVHQAQRLGTGGGILDEGQARGAVDRRAPGYAETGVEVRSERGPAAGVTGIQQVVLEVDRYMLARRGQLVTVRAAVAEIVAGAAAGAQRGLLPAGQVEQARIAREPAGGGAVVEVRQFVQQRDR